MRFTIGDRTYTETPRGFNVDFGERRHYTDVPIGLDFYNHDNSAFWHEVVLRQKTYWLARELGKEMDRP